LNIPGKIETHAHACGNGTIFLLLSCFEPAGAQQSPVKPT
jgi:hypothetical protein